MAKRKVLKITPVLITLNVMILVLIIGFYTARLIKYYLKENGHKDENESVLLADELIKNQSYLDDTKGLVLDEKTGIYRYKGDVNNNYLLYSGMIYRILTIDKDHNIKAVSEENVTLIYPNFTSGYEKSYVNKWLNKSDTKYSGIYENALIESDHLLVNTSMCSDKIDDLSKITCEETFENSKITLLSLYDYKEAGAKNSYLNNGTEYNLGTLNSKNKNYFITSDGEIGLNKKDSIVISIKPVITISSGSELIKGNGKIDSPYMIESHEINKLGDTYIGNYININDVNYRVIAKDDKNVKVVSTSVIMKDEKSKLSMAFGGKTSAYSTSKGTVGEYLNGTYLKSLSVKDLAVKGNWYTGTMSLTKLDYANVYAAKTSAKVGMLTVGDFFIEGVNNVFTLLRGIEAENIIDVLNKDGNLYGDVISSKYNVRPALYLNAEAVILSGDGSEDSPYEIGVNDGKEEAKTEEE